MTNVPIQANVKLTTGKTVEISNYIMYDYLVFYMYDSDGTPGRAILTIPIVSLIAVLDTKIYVSRDGNSMQFKAGVDDSKLTITITDLWYANYLRIDGVRN